MYNAIKYSLIAPCGMDCGICMAYLRETNKCPGCRFEYKSKPVTRHRCRIKNCPKMQKANSKFCFRCGSFPCAILKHLDKRYRTKYHMSMIENLKDIQKSGIRKFIRDEKKRWTCTECGGTISIHKGSCSECNAGILFSD